MLDLIEHKMYVFLVLFGVTLARAPVERSREEIDIYKTFLDDTRGEHGETLEERMAASPKAKVWENSGRYQGDILLDDLETDGLVSAYTTRNAYIWPNTKWPKNTVVYEFAPTDFDQAQKSAIIAAIRDIERHTCIRFRKRRSREVNYVRITGNPDGCYAHVGYWSNRGVHILNLARDQPGYGCFLHTIIIHEWMHIIGFLHMQSTYNRDDYVQVLWENMIPEFKKQFRVFYGHQRPYNTELFKAHSLPTLNCVLSDGLSVEQRSMEHNFEGYSSQIVSNLGVPYEYASNMHYGPYGFSKNGRPTLLGYYDHDNLMGQLDYVTRWDWLRANRHYNCPGAWRTILTELHEPASNYVPEDRQSGVTD